MYISGCYWEEFEGTKGAIKIRKSKKDRQHKSQKKKYKRINNDLQSIHIWFILLAPAV